MSQGARTVRELRVEVARLERANKRKQATIDRLKDSIECERRKSLAYVPRIQDYDSFEDYSRAKLLSLGLPQTLPPLSPATPVAAPDSSLARWRIAGTAACNRLRYFLRRLRWWRT